MLRALVMVLVLAVASAKAEDFRAETVVAFVRAQDRTGLEGHLDRAQGAFSQGELSAKKTCDLFIALSRNHH